MKLIKQTDETHHLSIDWTKAERGNGANPMSCVVSGETLDLSICDKESICFNAEDVDALIKLLTAAQKLL